MHGTCCRSKFLEDCLEVKTCHFEKLWELW